jgi:hypothetical protein
MTLEVSDTSTTVYIGDLEPANPTPSVSLREMDDHLRLTKRVLDNSFPYVTGAVAASDVELSFLDGLVSPIGPALARAGALNWLINGDLQFTATFTGTDATGLLAPGWELVANKTPSEVDVSHTTVTVAEAVAASLPYNAGGYITVLRGTTTQSTASYVVRQRIPAVRATAGRTFTLTGYFNADTAFDVAPTLRQVFGTGGSPSDAVTVSPNATASAVSATSAWMSRAWTFVIPSVAAKTFGTSASSDYLEVELDMPGSTDTTFSVAFSAVSLVEGTLASGYSGYPEEDPAVSRDRARSQYYEVPLTGAIGVAQASNVMSLPQVVLPTRMQRAPTVAAVSLARYVSGTSASMSGLTATGTTVDTFQATASSSGLSTYSGYILSGSLSCDARPGI